MPLAEAEAVEEADEAATVFLAVVAHEGAVEVVGVGNSTAVAEAADIIITTIIIKTSQAAVVVLEEQEEHRPARPTSPRRKTYWTSPSTWTRAYGSSSAVDEKVCLLLVFFLSVGSIGRWGNVCLVC